jgi:hypothetical protein
MPSQSGPLQQPGAAIGDLEQVRESALQTVADFRRTVISLEVKRIADSRVGCTMWEALCAKLFEDYKMSKACPLIVDARLQINSVFTEAATTNRVVFDRIEAHIKKAKSVAKISELLELMERNLTLNSEVRKGRAITILQRLRGDLFEVFGNLHDSRWYPTVYRMTLGLGSDGCYHPDPIPVQIDTGRPWPQVYTYNDEYFFAL